MLTLSRAYGLPLFVYDAGSIEHQIETLRRAFDVPDLEIHYACKALSTIGILKHIYAHGCGMDTVSPGEIEMALQAGVPPSRISFTPSGVHMDEYAYAIAKGVHIHVDQLHVLEWLDQHYPGTVVTLRFNPGIEAGGHTKLQVGSAGSKFGFLSSQTEEVKKRTESLSLRISGVHMHLGSDISDAQSFDQAYEYLLKVALLWSDSIDHVNLGGGFKIPYHPQDHVIDITSFGNQVSERFHQFCKDLGRNITMVLEPGKYLVSRAGGLLMKVTGVREEGHRPMVFVSSGFNHFLRPMSYGAYHHLINLTNPEGAIRNYDIVGYLCETDTFAINRPLPEVRSGDVLCLLNAGAYGYTMASHYNGRPRPAEVLVYPDGTHSLIRRAETIEDVLRTDLEYKSN
jgi:diaminopimelate decarboxylase